PRRPVELELVARTKPLLGRRSAAVHEHPSGRDRLAPCRLVGMPKSRDVERDHRRAGVLGRNARAIDVAAVRGFAVRARPLARRRPAHSTRVRSTTKHEEVKSPLPESATESLMTSKASSTVSSGTPFTFAAPRPRI